MAGTLTVWNVTPATKPTGISVRLYKQQIAPGQSAKLDARWVHQYPKALHGAIQQELVHLGESLPTWYEKTLEDRMKKLVHKGKAPVHLSAENFSPTVMEPGQEFTVADDVAAEMEEDLLSAGVRIVDAEEEEEDASEEEQEETEEEEEESPPKPKRTIKRGAVKARKTKAKK